MNKTPVSPAVSIELDVDKWEGDMGSQVEKIFLKTAQCPDGDYDYFRALLQRPRAPGELNHRL